MDILSYFQIESHKKTFKMVVQSGRYKNTTLVFRRAKIHKKPNPDGTYTMEIFYDVLSNPKSINIEQSVVGKNFGQYILTILKQELKRGLKSS